MGEKSADFYWPGLSAKWLVFTLASPAELYLMKIASPAIRCCPVEEIGHWSHGSDRKWTYYEIATKGMLR
jgi:hypothetical protein